MDAREQVENYIAKANPQQRKVDANDLATRPIESGGKVDLPYRAFSARHPDYDLPRWRMLRALYRGGKELLNPRTLSRVLARNNREPDEVYEFRCAQAFYLNYCSEIIDHLVANLAGDPAIIVKDGKPVGDADPISEWAKDVSSPQSESVTTLDQFVQEVVTEALLVRCAWVLLDKPEPEEPDADDDAYGATPAAPRSLAEAEELGIARACARVIPAEDVYHWECDPTNGRVLWALVGRCELTWKDFFSPPVVRETFTRYEDDTFCRWSIEYPVNSPPTPDTMVKIVDTDEDHGFERMPLRRFHLPPGLWAMDKLESPARAIFNKWCALDIAERRALLPILYEFMGAEQGAGRTPVSVAQQDPDRAVRTPRSPHHVQRRGRDDRAEFVGPSSDPFKVALASIDKLVQEVHRVLYQMALASDPKSAAAIGRSGASKQQDRAATVGVLQALGKRVRPFVRGLFCDVLHASGKADAEEEAKKYSADGFEKFDDIVESELVEETTMLLSIDIPSPTAKREIFMRLFRRLFDHLNDDEMQDIDDEIEQNLSNEENQGLPDDPDQQDAIMQGIAKAVGAQLGAAGGGGAPGGDGEEDGADKEPAAGDKAPPKKPAASSKALVDTEKARRRGARR